MNTRADNLPDNINDNIFNLVTESIKVYPNSSTDIPMIIASRVLNSQDPDLCLSNIARYNPKPYAADIANRANYFHKKHGIKLIDEDTAAKDNRIMAVRSINAVRTAISSLSDRFFLPSFILSPDIGEIGMLESDNQHHHGPAIDWAEKLDKYFLENQEIKSLIAQSLHYHELELIRESATHIVEIKRAATRREKI